MPCTTETKTNYTRGVREAAKCDYNAPPQGQSSTTPSGEKRNQWEKPASPTSWVATLILHHRDYRLQENLQGSITGNMTVTEKWGGA